MNMPAVIAAIAYPLVYAVAVYERLPISDWLTAHLPLLVSRPQRKFDLSSYGAHPHCASTRLA
jgi:hypothetical protein